MFGQAERLVSDIRLTVGSSSVITACAAQRLGLRVAMVGVVGADPLGRFMLEAMVDRGLDIEGVRVDAAVPTGASVILSDGQDRAILTAPGTIGMVDSSDVTATRLSRARHLHIGSWFLQRDLWETAAEVLTSARAAGLTISIDPNWDPADDWDRGILDLLPLIDVFLPNEAEVTRIARIGDVTAAAAELARSGPLVVVKRGGTGAIAVDATGHVEDAPAYPVTPLDTTGAGDAFDAGFLVRWLDGGSVLESLRMGAVCGALSTAAIGGVDGQPTREAAEAALAAWSS